MLYNCCSKSTGLSAGFRFGAGIVLIGPLSSSLLIMYGALGFSGNGAGAAGATRMTGAVGAAATLAGGKRDGKSGGADTLGPDQMLVILGVGRGCD